MDEEFKTLGNIKQLDEEYVVCCDELFNAEDN